MLTITIKKTNINFLNFFNKTVLNKNILTKTKKSKIFKIKIRRIKTTSKVVTLRAPKHFKVGRHHYNVITKLMQYKFKLTNCNFYIKENNLYNYINFFNFLILNKKLPNAFSNLNSIKTTFKIKKLFFLH